MKLFSLSEVRSHLIQTFHFNIYSLLHTDHISSSLILILEMLDHLYKRQISAQGRLFLSTDAHFLHLFRSLAAVLIF